MPRIVVVSNRLPVTLHPDRPAEQGGEVAESSGGLVSALRRVASALGEELVWIGWPGCSVSNEAEERRLTRVLRERKSQIQLAPVWLSEKDVVDFYNGFSNSSLWPLLHWMTPYARFKKAWAESYRRVNDRFADVVLSIATPDDLIWVQDYHLFLVPQMLRKKREFTNVQQSPRGGEASTNLPATPARPTFLPRLNSSHSNLDEAAQEGAQAAEELLASAISDLSEFRPPDRSNVVQRGSTRHSFATAGDEDEARPAEERKLRIAFFLHTPFPPHEVLCVLPQCQDIVEGLLGADLVGFHTYSYLRHFRSCVVRLCGLTPEIDRIDHKGQRTRLGVFPIGANHQDIAEAMETRKFTTHLEEYTKQYEGKSLVLSVERLDYSKGVPQKLDAIRRYLEQAEAAKIAMEASATSEGIVEGEHPPVEGERLQQLEDLQLRFRGRDEAKEKRTWRRIGPYFQQLFQGAQGKAKRVDHTKTVFLFIAVPSRQEVQEYKQIEEEVHRTISTINGQFSTPTHQPIVYIHRAVKMEELAALYARADCCLVTPLIDGMNLVAKEYIAAKDRQIPNVVPGTIVLSELAGAAQELFDAIVVNPYDEDAVADAIAVGLELVNGMDEELRWEVTRRMREHVIQNDAIMWARTLLEQLQVEDVAEPAPAEEATIPLTDKDARKFYSKIDGSKAIFLDYDGTLRELENRPEMALPDEETHNILKGLDSREDLFVFIVSGRTKEFLEEHFGKYRNFTLVAEHGHLKREPDVNEWRTFNPFTSTDWMDKVKPIMQLFERCTPGAFIEVKSACIVWHYRECDDEYGSFKAKELVHLLALSLGNLPCVISQGHKIVEVASLEVKKGMIVRSACYEQQVSYSSFDEILCIGDDQTDESMFSEAKLAHKGAYTVKVGLGDTYARYRLQSPEEVRRFLRLIVDEPAPRCSQASNTGRRSGRYDPSTVTDEKGLPISRRVETSVRDTFKSCEVPFKTVGDKFMSCEAQAGAGSAGSETPGATEDPLADIPECEDPFLEIPEQETTEDARARD